MHALFRRGRMLTVSVLALAFITIGISVWRWSIPRHASLTGTISSLNVEGRSGVLQVIHPKTGEPLELRGKLAADCEVVVNGAPAPLSDLAAGDRVKVEGLFYRDGSIVATRVAKLSGASEPKSRAAAP